ncbi:hypothetical protein [Solirubrobacter soli]|uniref:hypothetical protein n=1 Tax=Solirubrobacter soli TaxID=363832 RepID=UPI00048552AC|nr:hypothetical protein [Solirubrobacter soli]
MSEQWATFSIYDHRRATFRRALVLFDRVVVPVPSQPFGRLDAKEIETLEADIAFLADADAAVRFEWDPARFAEYEAGVVRESAATFLDGSPEWRTRMQLVHAVKAGSVSLAVPDGVRDVSAVPVYQTADDFKALAVDTAGEAAEQDTLELILDHIPVPADDTPLELVVELRDKPAFRQAKLALDLWRTTLVLELLEAGEDAIKRKAVLSKASAELAKWAADYTRAMSDTKFAKVEAGFTFVGVIGKLLSLDPTVVQDAKDMVMLRTIRQPCWRALAGEPFAPAGVIYEASQAWQHA